MTPAARTQVTGHYAGPVSRAVALAADIGISLGLYSGAYAILTVLGDSILGHQLVDDLPQGLNGALLVLWTFFYGFVSLAIAGKTPGKALVGLLVVSSDGSTLPVRRAFIRTLVYPLSALLLGLGFLLALVQREHRALHDLIAKTAVVYDWGDRPAELPGPLSAFLKRRGAEQPLPSPPPVPGS